MMIILIIMIKSGMSMIITWMEGTVLISNNDNDDNKWSWFYDEIALKNSELGIAVGILSIILNSNNGDINDKNKKQYSQKTKETTNSLRQHVLILYQQRAKPTVFTLFFCHHWQKPRAALVFALCRQGLTPGNPRSFASASQPPSQLPQLLAEKPQM